MQSALLYHIGLYANFNMDFSISLSDKLHTYQKKAD